MKLSLEKLLIIFVAIAFTVPVHLVGLDSDWSLLKITNEGTFFYDSINITNLSKETIGVSLKTVYLEKFKKQEDLKKLGHTVGIWEINCKEKMIRLLSVSHYSNDGKMLDSPSPVLLPDWELIASGTVLEDLYRNVCK